MTNNFLAASKNFSASLGMLEKLLVMFIVLYDLFCSGASGKHIHALMGLPRYIICLDSNSNYSERLCYKYNNYLFIINKMYF